MLINVIKDILLFFEHFCFFYVFFCRDFRKKTKKETIGVTACVLIWLIGLVFHYDWHYTDLLPISRVEILIFILVFLIFEIRIIEYVPMVLGGYLLNVIMGLSLWIPLQKLNINSDLRMVLYDIMVLAIIWLYYIIFCRKKENSTLNLPARMWWVVDGILAVLVLMMTFFSYVIIEMIPYNDTMAVGRIIAVLGSTFICILLFVLIYYYNSTQSFRVQKELAEIQNEQQRIYFKGLLDKEEETRQFRHDIINDMLEIKNYSVKHEYDKLEKYIDSTLGAITDISKRSFDVGNDIVNTIINFYMQPIKNDYNVEVSGYMGSAIEIAERDLCTVCANLVKNAVEAVSMLDSGIIIFDVEQGNQYLSIMVENTYSGNIITDKEGKLVTQKEDKKNHGIGINNVKRIVKKYKGRYETEIDDKSYRVKVFLKIG